MLALPMPASGPYQILDTGGYASELAVLEAVRSDAGNRDEFCLLHQTETVRSPPASLRK